MAARSAGLGRRARAFASGEASRRGCWRCRTAARCTSSRSGCCASGGCPTRWRTSPRAWRACSRPWRRGWAWPASTNRRMCPGVARLPAPTACRRCRGSLSSSCPVTARRSRAGHARARAAGLPAGLNRPPLKSTHDSSVQDIHRPPGGSHRLRRGGRAAGRLCVDIVTAAEAGNAGRRPSEAASSPGARANPSPRAESLAQRQGSQAQAGQGSSRAPVPTSRKPRPRSTAASCGPRAGAVVSRFDGRLEHGGVDFGGAKGDPVNARRRRRQGGLRGRHAARLRPAGRDQARRHLHVGLRPQQRAAG